MSLLTLHLWGAPGHAPAPAPPVTSPNMTAAWTALLGTGMLGTMPLLGAATDVSVLPPRFYSLLRDPDAHRVYLLEATPYDPATSGTVTVRASAGAIWPSYDGAHWPARLIEPMAFQSLLSTTGDSILSPRTQPGFGRIRLAIGDGDLDTWARYAWDGRRVTLLMGGIDFTYDEFQPVLSGTARDVTWTEDELVIEFRDPTEQLQVPLQSTLYTGSGGLEGAADLTGQPKPLAFGRCFNIAPVLVNHGFQVYQVHDGPIEAIPGVFDRAVTLTNTGDVSISSGDPGATQPSPGQYVTDLAKGLFQLGTEPDGPLTTDVHGDKTGGTYVETVPDLVTRLVTTYGPLTDPDDLDNASFAALALLTTAPVGRYIAHGEQPTIPTLLNELVSSIGGYWDWAPTGTLRVGQIAFTPSIALLESTKASMVHGTLRRLITPLPPQRMRLGYARAYVVQAQADLDKTLAPQDRKDFVAVAHRYAVSPTASYVQQQHLTAPELVRDTLLALEADAGAEVDREHLLLAPVPGSPTGTWRDLLEVTLVRWQFRFQVGQTVQFLHPRFGFATPRSMLILGVREDTLTGQTTLTLWG